MGVGVGKKMGLKCTSPRNKQHIRHERSFSASLTTEGAHYELCMYVSSVVVWAVFHIQNFKLQTMNPVM